MSAQHKHSITHLYTLSQSHSVNSMDMRATDDMSAAIVVIGLDDGHVRIFKTPLSHTKPIQFQLLKQFQAHTDCINALHMHATKPLFATGSDDHNVKIWSALRKKSTDPLLIKCIEHADYVTSVRYSPSGLLLTGCNDGVLRVYGAEPLCSPRWSCKLSNSIGAVAWSPSNRIACSFLIGHSGTVQVWDSDFHPIFQHKQHGALRFNFGLSFVSDDLLLCSSYASKTLYSYNIPNSEVTAYPFPDFVFGVTSLTSEIVCASCEDNVLRVYKVHGTKLRLLATLPHEGSVNLVSCVYPFKDAGYMLVSSSQSTCFHVSVTSRFNIYWVREVMKIVLNSKILPFCRDVHKIIFKYFTR